MNPGAYALGGGICHLLFLDAPRGLHDNQKPLTESMQKAALEVLLGFFLDEIYQSLIKGMKRHNTQQQQRATTPLHLHLHELMILLMVVV